MSRIANCFETLKKNNTKALIAYVAAGDPNPEITVPMMNTLVESGADIIELGIPFSDPMADGPVIQKASERALVYGTSLTDVLESVAEFRKTNSDTPVVLMGYLNPIEIMGYARFAEKARDAGVDGVLTVDIPPEEAGEYLKAMESCDIDPVFLLSPTTERKRMEAICSIAKGFVYYISVKGVTGSGALDIDAVAERLKMVREVTPLPVGVGFGIKNAESAANVARVADAVVVGSALVSIVEQHAPDNDAILRHVKQTLSAMRSAINEV